MNSHSITRGSILLVLLVLFYTHPGFGMETLEILAEDDAGAWSLKDGTGYANDVVRAAFNAAGVEINLQVVPYERAKRMVLKGTKVACFSMSWLPEYSGKIILPDKPLFTFQTDYMHNLEKPLPYKNQEEIGKKIIVGTVAGYEYPAPILRLREKGLVVFEESPSEELNLKKLAAGRLDASLLIHNKIKTAWSIMTPAAVIGKVDKVFSCGEMGCFIGFSQLHPRGLWARDKFNEGFRMIESNGQFRKIVEAWTAKAIMEIKQPASNSSGKSPDVRSQKPSDKGL